MSWTKDLPVSTWDTLPLRLRCKRLVEQNPWSQIICNRYEILLRDDITEEGKFLSLVKDDVMQ